MEPGSRLPIKFKTKKHHNQYQNMHQPPSGSMGLAQQMGLAQHCGLGLDHPINGDSPLPGDRHHGHPVVRAWAQINVFLVFTRVFRLKLSASHRVHAHKHLHKGAAQAAAQAAV